MTTETPQIPPRFITVNKWSDYFDWPPEGGLRHIIFNAHLNGFSPAIKRVGRRVLIDHEKFWDLVDQQHWNDQP